ncbi:hexosaminidase [Blastococcus aurantiacus]|uniref:beta-N-acetylhexosaminidase n=1 Tax=Blastococcus aurantiacus TaxID=1550231 RepID=A0A1G7NTQ6_9ACTN|nr:hexosaminidase [Blastococcus aurantiacus]
MPPIVPAPQRLTASGDTRAIGEALLVTGDEEVREVVEVLGRLAPGWAGLELRWVDDDASADVLVRLGPPDLAPDLPEPSGPDPSGGTSGDERYSVAPVDGRLVLRGASPHGAFRGLTTVLQAAAGTELPLFAAADAPRTRWRGLSLDVARFFLPPAQIEKVIDLMALYRLDVLHLHLTDSQAWRLELADRPALTGPDVGSPGHYTADDLAGLVAYAARRFVTVVPEIDLPGHVLAALRAHPELRGGVPPLHPLLGHLSPSVPAAMAFAREAVEALVGVSPSPYVHVGGDEAFGMPDEEYVAFVRVVHGWVREAGKRPVAWQEASRARAFGPGDVLQLWIAPSDAPREDRVRAAAPADLAHLVDAFLATFREAPGDLGRALEDGAAVLLSPSLPFYLDRRYAEPSTDPAQTADLTRLGHAGYPRARTSDLSAWSPDDVGGLDPAAVAGMEAAIWAESIESFDDLAMLLLPRLPVLAELMWTGPRRPWPDLATRLRPHAAAWTRSGFGAYYRSADLFPA